MQRPAEDFGNAGIVRFYCDGCSKPLQVCYQGNNGQYCSKACLECHDNRKVKTPEPLKVKTEKVKINGVAKVKMAQASPLRQKVKIAEPSQVRTVPVAKVKTEPALARKEKIAPRNQQRIRRRAAIKRIRAEIMAATGREPTIAEVQSHLAPLELNASVRTVWKDLDYCRAVANG